MNDKELLELAAKAEGRALGIWQGNSFEAPFHGDWNPLTDDGDALRLAVKLGLSIVCPAEHSMSSARAWLNPSGAVETETRNNDPYFATRKSIVRAAAEIGKEIP